MIREDRELLTELARLNREMAPLALRMMEGSASIAEQHSYAERLIATGERLKQRAEGTTRVVIEGDVLTDGPSGRTPRGSKAVTRAMTNGSATHP